jgi:UTP--glucose-1-phosphate uridylyltransferase
MHEGGAMNSQITEFEKKMEAEKLDRSVKDAFKYYYDLVCSGSSGQIREKDITTPKEENLVRYSELDKKNQPDMNKLAVVKLNGGLGTSMGLDKAKSLLPVKDSLTFLDIITKQILVQRELTGSAIPLIFLNSFNTREDTLSILQQYPQIKTEKLPLDMMQNKFPKIKQSDLSVFQHPSKAWNPPGHGEVYAVLQQSGVLDILLELGIEYAFISNSDNLSATADPAILAYLIDNEIPFLMEVCNREESDKKGGHLAQTPDGQLILREVAQCPNSELAEFQNIQKYKYFNTNNLWINLPILKKKLTEHKNFLPLPLILNSKSVDDTDVYQIETAMGAAISVFEAAKALVVDRSRFAPVKKSSDLLALWSDAYQLQEDFSIKLAQQRKSPPDINLDDRYYKTYEQLQERCRVAVPSLKQCDSLTIEGDVHFGKGVVIKGRVRIKAATRVVLSAREISEDLIL